MRRCPAVGSAAAPSARCRHQWRSRWRGGCCACWRKQRALPGPPAPQGPGLPALANRPATSAVRLGDRNQCAGAVVTSAAVVAHAWGTHFACCGPHLAGVLCAAANRLTPAPPSLGNLGTGGQVGREALTLSLARRCRRGRDGVCALPKRHPGACTSLPVPRACLGQRGPHWRRRRNPLSLRASGRVRSRLAGTSFAHAFWGQRCSRA